MNNLIKEISEYPKFYTKTNKIDVPGLRRKGFFDTTLYFSIVENTSFLKDDVSLGNRVFCLHNHITNNPLCNCGNELKFISNVKGYRKICSIDCKCKPEKSKKVIIKAKASKLKRYGSENYNNPEKHKETCLKKYGNETFTNPDKQKETKALFTKEKKQSIIIKCRASNLERYGVDNIFQSETFKSKAKSSKLERYGNERYVNTDKIKETKLERYGSENYVNTDKQKETKALFTKEKKQSINVKRKLSNLERNGDENYNNLEKQKETNLKKYGVEHYSQSKEFNNKCIETNIERYGVNHHTHKVYDDGVYDKICNKEWLLKQHHELKKTPSSIAYELNVDHTTIINYLKKSNITIEYFSTQSVPEKMLIEMISNITDTKVITNTRSIIPPKEIDIYLPEYNLAIEFNGRYWHSPNRYGSKENWSNYHQDKIDKCKEKDIQLLHIWENHYDYESILLDAINNNIIDNNLDKIYKEVKWI